jgi:hypothetical protein
LVQNLPDLRLQASPPSYEPQVSFGGEKGNLWVFFFLLRVSRVLGAMAALLCGRA